MRSLVVPTPVAHTTWDDLRNLERDKLPFDGITSPVHNGTKLLRTLRHRPAQGLEQTHTLSCTREVVDKIRQDDLPVLCRSDFESLAGKLLLEFKRDIALPDGIEMILLTLKVLKEVAQEQWDVDAELIQHVRLFLCRCGCVEERVTAVSPLLDQDAVFGVVVFPLVSVLCVSRGMNRVMVGEKTTDFERTEKFDRDRNKNPSAALKPGPAIVVIIGSQESTGQRQ